MSLPFRSGSEWSGETYTEWPNDESEKVFLEKLETPVKKLGRSWELLIN